MVINHRHSLARREYIKRHDSFTRALSRREITIWDPLSSRANTHVQALALIDGGLRGTPRARARSRQGRRDEGRKEVYGNREEERKKKERNERQCRPLGSKAQKNSVACHGAESTPKIHSPVPLSHVCKVAWTLQNALLDRRRDTATSESISKSALDGSQNFAYAILSDTSNTILIVNIWIWLKCRLC